MVKITYNGTKLTRRRLPSGRWLTWKAGESVEVESNRLAEELKNNRAFVVEENSSPKVGGGVKTHVKTPKSRGRPRKSKIQEKVDKVVTEPKPKGLKNKKAKKGKAD
tara:strand:- start:56 stop:376 length:321 start_codon:yes stop_codon:yes gene_type:complete